MTAWHLTQSALSALRRLGRGAYSSAKARKAAARSSARVGKRVPGMLWLGFALCLSACATLQTRPNGPEVAARWDHHPEALGWTAAVQGALYEEFGQALLTLRPADIDAFCPGWDRADRAGRAAFWVAVLSEIARIESGLAPTARGANGRYRGLLQISPATARAHGCAVDALYEGESNLACGVRLAARAVVRDGVLAEGRRGLAAEWPPLANPGRRAALADYTRTLPMCTG